MILFFSRKYGEMIYRSNHKNVAKSEKISSDERKFRMFD